MEGPLHPVVPETTVAHKLANLQLYVIAGFVLLVPLIVDVRGIEAFRVPKDLAIRGEAIILTGLLLVQTLWRQRKAPERWYRDPFILLPIAVTISALLSTATSRNLRLSIPGLAWVVGCAVIFFATYKAAGCLRFSAVWLVLAPATVNSVLYLLQETGTWNPFFQRDIPVHEWRTALIGNPNDVGAYLVSPALGAVAAALADRPNRRVYSGIAVLLFATLVANKTITAIVAAGAGLLTLGVMRRRRQTLRAGLLAALVLIGVLAGLNKIRPIEERIYGAPLHHRVRHLVYLAANGRFDEFLSHRLPGFAAAILMTSDSPIVGIGPNVYRWAFFDYRLRAEEKFPSLADTEARGTNFAEAHSDHLQTLAETGAVGYLAFWICLILLAGCSRPQFAPIADAHDPRRDDVEDVRSRFSYYLAAPCAVSLLVLTLTGFPLRLAAPTSVYIFVSALCAAWRVRH